MSEVFEFGDIVCAAVGVNPHGGPFLFLPPNYVLDLSDGTIVRGDPVWWKLCRHIEDKTVTVYVNGLPVDPSQTTIRKIAPGAFSIDLSRDLANDDTLSFTYETTIS